MQTLSHDFVKLFYHQQKVNKALTSLKRIKKHYLL